MSRLFAFTCIVFAFALIVSASGEAAQAQKNQMVKGTIKEVQVDKDVLVINQKVKNEFVDRELSILDSTEFVVTKGGDTKTAIGRKGLELLNDANPKGASVQVKCDKDVNVLKVTVKIK